MNVRLFLRVRYPVGLIPPFWVCQNLPWVVVRIGDRARSSLLPNASEDRRRQYAECPDTRSPW